MTCPSLRCRLAYNHIDDLKFSEDLVAYSQKFLDGTRIKLSSSPNCSIGLYRLIDTNSRKVRKNIYRT